MKDVKERKDLDFIVHEFYNRVLEDNKIAPVFTSTVKIDWKTHLPIISDFWENLLWGGNKYQENLLQKHLDFNDKIPFTRLHLERWLLHWTGTINDNFSAENATEIQNRAVIIGRIIMSKIQQ